MSEDLKWEKQCSAAVQKANKMLGMIKRNFTDRSKETVMGTGSYSDTPYSNSSYSDNSYSAAKVFMHVRNCHCTFGGNFIHFVRRPFQHVYFSTIASVCYSLLFNCTCFVGLHRDDCVYLGNSYAIFRLP